MADTALTGKPADTPSYTRLTNAERVLILKLRDDGLTQVQIAQRLGRAQSTIADVLHAFEDTTDIASRYLHAKALQMAENIVEKGKPRDHNVTLAGIGVLKQERSADIRLMVGISLPGMPTLSPAAIDVQSESPENQAT